MHKKRERKREEEDKLDMCLSLSLPLTTIRVVCFWDLFPLFLELWTPTKKRRRKNEPEQEWKKIGVLFNKQFRARHRKGEVNKKKNRKEIVISSLARARSLSCRLLLRRQKLLWTVTNWQRTVTAAAEAAASTTTENWNGFNSPDEDDDKVRKHRPAD